MPKSPASSHCQLQADQQDQPEQWKLTSWLPSDSNMLLFEIIALTCLVAAIIQFIRTGDVSMLTALLTWAGAHVGLVKVRQIVHKR